MGVRTIFLLFSLYSFSVIGQTATLNISGIRNTKGKLQVAVFKNAKQFDDEKAEKVYYYSKNNLNNGKKKITISLASGTYAITVLDDEDNNKNMTYRFGIYPLEGVGFSNYILSGLSKPDFEDFDFTLHGKENKNIMVIMKYF